MYHHRDGKSSVLLSPQSNRLVNYHPSWSYSFFIEYAQNKKLFKISEQFIMINTADTLETSRVNTITGQNHQRTIRPSFCRALTYTYSSRYHFELAQSEFHTPTFSPLSSSLPPSSSKAGIDLETGLFLETALDFLLFKKGGSHSTSLLLQRPFWSSAGPNMHLRNLAIQKKTPKSKQLLWTQAFYAIPPT